MKILGILICVLGTVGAVLFIPCQILGINLGWHFILEEANFGLGITVHAYDLIDTTTLILELIGVNAIGLTLFFLGRRREEIKR